MSALPRVLRNLTAVSVLGLRRDRIGAAGRLVATVGTVAVLATGYAVGKAGGELVYQHGAASAYTDGATLPPRVSEEGEGERPYPVTFTNDQLILLPCGSRLGRNIP